MRAVSAVGNVRSGRRVRTGATIILSWTETLNISTDSDDLVLFAYTCDMPCIRRFDSALAVSGHKVTLCCFDFQEDAILQFRHQD